MDTKKAFLNTSKTLMRAMQEMYKYRIAGNTFFIATISVNLTNRDLYEENDSPAIKELRRVSPDQLNIFNLLHNESSIVLAYSWLDTYLSEVEEVMFLHDPASLGESVEIKLGKILGSTSLDEVVHDLARKRVRERGQWGLKSRISELKKKYGFDIKIDDSDLEWMADFRNNLVHNRRIGSFNSLKGKVHYKEIARRDGKENDDVRRFMDLSFTILGQLYLSCSKKIGLTKKYPQHRINLEFVDVILSPLPIVK